MRLCGTTPRLSLHDARGCGFRRREGHTRVRLGRERLPRGAGPLTRCLTLPFHTHRLGQSLARLHLWFELGPLSAEELEAVPCRSRTVRLLVLNLQHAPSPVAAWVRLSPPPPPPTTNDPPTTHLPKRGVPSPPEPHALLASPPVQSPLSGEGLCACTSLQPGHTEAQSALV